VGYDPPKVGKLWVTLLISRTGAGIFFLKRGAMSNFFFEKGAVGQKRLGTCVVDRTSFVIGGVVAIAEKTAYCTGPDLAVATEGQMITGAIDATRL
jgi:hypothetical protein